VVTRSRTARPTTTARLHTPGGLTLVEEQLRPRRTLRVVLWTNEENGLRGGKAYREALGTDVASHVAAF
jgi:Zn-dependent M28 family amino/carboxypeptidase